MPKQKNVWLALDFGGDLRSGPDTELTTKSWKKVPYNPGDFACPQGYAKRELFQIAMSAGQKEHLSEIIKTIGFVGEDGAFEGNSATRAAGAARLLSKR